MKALLIAVSVLTLSQTVLAKNVIAPFKCDIGTKAISEDAKHKYGVKSVKGKIVDSSLDRRLIQITGRKMSGLYKVEVISLDNGVEVSAFTTAEDDGGLVLTLPDNVNNEVSVSIDCSAR